MVCGPAARIGQVADAHRRLAAFRRRLDPEPERRAAVVRQLDRLEPRGRSRSRRDDRRSTGSARLPRASEIRGRRPAAARWPSWQWSVTPRRRARRTWPSRRDRRGCASSTTAAIRDQLEPTLSSRSPSTLGPIPTSINSPAPCPGSMWNSLEIRWRARRIEPSWLAAPPYNGLVARSVDSASGLRRQTDDAAMSRARLMSTA